MGTDETNRITDAIQRIASVVRPVVYVIKDLAQYFLEVIKTGNILNAALDDLPAPLRVFAAVLGSILDTQLDQFKGVIRVIAALLRGDWQGAWTAAKQTVVQFGQNLMRTGQLLGRAMIIGLSGWITLISKLKGHWAPLDRIINHSIATAQHFIEAVRAAFAGDWAGVLGHVLAAFAHFYAQLGSWLLLIGALIVKGFQAIPWGTILSLAWAGLVALAKAFWDAIPHVLSALNTLALMALQALSDFALELIQKGSDAMANWLSGLDIGWQDVLLFIGKIVAIIPIMLWKLAEYLFPVGTAVIIGWMTGLADAVTNRLWPWLSKIPQGIINFFSGAGEWLKTAGYNIIAGLVQGIYDAGETILRDALSWVTDQIPNWKGPRERDKKLLTPAGKAILQGLVKGLLEERPALKRNLEGVTKMVRKELIESMPHLVVGSDEWRDRRQRRRRRQERRAEPVSIVDWFLREAQRRMAQREEPASSRRRQARAHQGLPASSARAGPPVQSGDKPVVIHVHSNATDPEVVARIVIGKLYRAGVKLRAGGQI
jgi:hypothetical protein